MPSEKPGLRGVQFIHSDRRKTAHLDTDTNRQLDVAVGMCDVLSVASILLMHQEAGPSAERGERCKRFEDLGKGVRGYSLGSGQGKCSRILVSR